MKLCDLVRHRAKIAPASLALRGPDADLTYSELDSLADQCAQVFAQLGVRRGDRVGIWLDKSSCMVAVMQGILRLQAIYVPLDPLSPASRICTIIRDCDMRLLMTTQKRAEGVSAAGFQHVPHLGLDDARSGQLWGNLVALSYTGTENLSSANEHSSFVTNRSGEDEAAYILYTSGSTGQPKGVCISNRNALAFIEWARDVLQPTPDDRFANHAPFHFDLSVLDLYVAFASGAMVFLIPDTVSFIPQYLVDCIIREQLTIWYSVPSVLTLMIEHGSLLHLDALPLRAILFAGEPFSLKYLKQLYRRWSGSTRFLNLYGPTETNVCTFYEVTHLSEEQTHPIPIGKACSGDRVWARKEDGTPAQPGEKGELMVEGASVMIGYWGQPERGDKPYATGDLVQLQEDGDYLYLGRCDQMLKIRGYRIEPSEIEAALEQHQAIAEAAVVAVGKELEAKLIAFVVVATTSEEPQLLDIKRHCAERLPRYMTVDELRFLAKLPRTRNGKVDRLALLQSFD